jgi:hypothetical protein
MTERPNPGPKRAFLGALARMLDAFVDGAERTRTGVNAWFLKHEEGITLFVIVVGVLSDVVPSVGDLADEWQDGPWRYLLTNVELGDALGLLVQLADKNDAVEQLLEAVLADPAVVDELSDDLDQAPLTDALRHQLRHGLHLLQEHDYVLAVPAFIQALEGAFWHIAEEEQLIWRDGDAMRRVTYDGTLGKPVRGVETILDLLDLDETYLTFAKKLVFGGRGHRFRHATAHDGWRLEALLLVVALTTWLEVFGPKRETSYLRRAFANSHAPLDAATGAFPALGALAEMKPDALRPTVTALMSFAELLRSARLRLSEGPAVIEPDGSGE